MTKINAVGTNVCKNIIRVSLCVYVIAIGKCLEQRFALLENVWNKDLFGAKVWNESFVRGNTWNKSFVRGNTQNKSFIPVKIREYSVY